MRRDVLEKLVLWKDSSLRKPLVLRGARQTGKTWLLKEFGKECFTRTHCLNFQDKPELKKLFSDGYDPEKIIPDIEIFLRTSINPVADLLIFDEIQECPPAITSLKYFCENRPQQALCAAGSHIGLTLSNASFPVGKVDFLNLYPLTFQEFLFNKNERLFQAYETAILEGQLSAMNHSLLWDELKRYYITGGMPEVVRYHIDHPQMSFQNFQDIRKLQAGLLEGYRADFAKHAGKVNASHINSIFSNIPIQLQKIHDGSVQRFRFKGVVENKSKFAQMSGPIDWLVQAGLALKTPVAGKAAIPLKAYCQENLFKLYFFDAGLLGAALSLPPEALLGQDYGSFKGYFAENFVAQELVAGGEENLFAWTEGGAEIEFLLMQGTRIIPVEVKAGTRTKARSLQAYKQRYHPEVSIKLSGLNLNFSKNHIDCPLFMAGRLRKLIGRLLDGQR